VTDPILDISLPLELSIKPNGVSFNQLVLRGQTRDSSTIRTRRASSLRARETQGR